MFKTYELDRKRISNMRMLSLLSQDIEITDEIADSLGIQADGGDNPGEFLREVLHMVVLDYEIQQNKAKLQKSLEKRDGEIE